ncbi:hypothetical protein ACN28G_28740 [Micromonospora sp. WMMA1923]|uniref:hypothetical protein n=1 Tax=Micromonospora sp. WMMA1923 TaxID=3404125 RepID=UPI003B93F96D
MPPVTSTRPLWPVTLRELTRLAVTLLVLTLGLGGAALALSGPPASAAPAGSGSATAPDSRLVLDGRLVTDSRLVLDGPFGTGHRGPVHSRTGPVDHLAVDGGAQSWSDSPGLDRVTEVALPQQPSSPRVDGTAPAVVPVPVRVPAAEPVRGLPARRGPPLA